MLLLAQVEEVQQLVERPAPPVERGEQLQHLGDRELRVERGGLERDADPLLELGRIAGHVEPEDRDLAPVGHPEPLEDLDGGGLAGAVRTEQAEDLARATSKLTPATAATSP